MPPRPKVPKELIINTAFELTRQFGFEKVTARMLAAELNCSTQPIFHVFQNMEELKHEVYLKTKTFFEGYMLQPSKDVNTPYFLSMGLRYIELVRKEKHLFQLLCMSDSSGEITSLYSIAEHLPVPIDPDVFVKTWIFTHGVASIVSTNSSSIPEQEIRRILTEACTSFTKK